ncbi:unnamed protein product [Calicophoron daubneyi]|uniref:MICOS complex subunit MIC60 n=1 Tax=Calicophoron daubneyi TaxID=300641 RepID=A0AAV2TSP1_CALDB
MLNFCSGRLPYLVRIPLLQRNFIQQPRNFGPIINVVCPSTTSFSSSTSGPEYIPPRKPRRYLRKLLFAAILSTAALAGVWYSSDYARDLVASQYPEVDATLRRMNGYAGDLYHKVSSWTARPEKPQSSLPFLSSKDNEESQAPHSKLESEIPKFPLPVEHKTIDEPSPSLGLPSVDDVKEMTHEKVKSMGALVTPADIDNAISEATRGVQSANISLAHLESATRKHIDALRDALQTSGPLEDEGSQMRAKSKDRKWDQVSRFANAKDLAQERAGAAVDEAKKRLDTLRETLNQYKLDSDSALESPSLPAGITAYGDLQYDLAGSIHKVRKLQNELHMLMRYRDLITKTHGDIQKNLDEIRENIDLNSKGGTSLSVGELNSLIVVAHDRISKLQSLLADAEEKEKARLSSALEAQRRADEELIGEVVQRELERQRSLQEKARYDWEVEARKNTQRELRLALARHSDHLSHMLRLKENELEHQFTYRIREEIAKEKTAFEAALSGWTQRMRAIEDVVDGRAELDRIAKEAQGLWLACEALACSLSSAKPTGPETSPYADLEVTGPLDTLVGAVREAASTGSNPFALAVLDSLPPDVTENGVWMERGLKKRFEKVYKVCRRVALLDETGGSLWSYMLSWLQSVLMFDSFGRKYLDNIPWFRSNLPKPPLEGDSEVDNEGSTKPEMDTFSLLWSARAALRLTEDEQDMLKNADEGIELAVRLLGQLRGQARLVAADWLADARRYLEVRQAAQVLLAYAAARNMSSFQKRL